MKLSRLRIAQSYSVASRIQNLLAVTKDDIRANQNPGHDVIGAAKSLIKNHNYKMACDVLLANLDLQDFESFMSEVSPHMSEFSKSEFAYILWQNRLDAFIEPSILNNFQLIDALDRVPLSSLDTVLQRFGIRFPQVLYSEKSEWFRTKLLIKCFHENETYARVQYERYRDKFSSHALESILQDCPKQFDYFEKLLFRVNERAVTMWSSGDVEKLRLLIELANKKQLPKMVKKLAKRDLPADIWSQMLHRALILNLSYEISRIMRYGMSHLPSRMIGRALLAVAWSQHNPGGDDEAFTTAEDVNRDVVSQVASTIPANRLNGVLYYIFTQDLPARIMWAVLLGIQGQPLSLKGSLTRRMAGVMVKRPDLEQMRYMTLPQTSALAASQLLKFKLRSIDHGSLTQDEVKMVIAGMVLLSEKSEPQNSKSFGSVVEQMFSQWSADNVSRTLNVLTTLYAPAPRITLTIIGMLVAHKKYALAIRLLEGQVPNKELPQKMFYDLLLSVCQDFPKISLALTTWLIKVANVFITPQTLQRMIVILSEQRKLNDHESITRINSLIKLLRGLNATPGPAAASAIVDGLIDRAIIKGGGSRRRLQWALDMCKEENVPQQRVQRWLQKINHMRKHGQGYWARR